MEEQFINGDTKKTPDIVELDNKDYCDDIFTEVENPESLENYNTNFETYQKDMNDMSKYEELQLQTMNEQLEMRKRVEDWHDKLRPILEDDEIRSPFDVHEYGSRVLNCFKLIGEQKSFKDLFGGLVQEEVSRYFLSILMMVNTGNLKIQNEVGYEIIMKLLKKESNNEEL